MQFMGWKSWLVGAVVGGVMAAVGVGATAQDTAADVPVTDVSENVAAGATATLQSVADPTSDQVSEIETDADFSVAVLDVESGESLSYGEGVFDTASIVKVDILAALMYQHQEAGTALTAHEQALATAMIERSDNASATALFTAVGGQIGLESFNDLIGLSATEIGSDGNWGLTQTTAQDQIRVLQMVFTTDSLLTASSQQFMQTLMSNVVAEQNFGVSAASDDPDDASLKVGYLQRSSTGLWDVTSIGQIAAHGRTYLVAVLSDSNAGFAEGVDLVDQVARAAVEDMTAI